MADYTENLNLEKPSQSEDYDVDVFNNNFNKIDIFAGQVPARALTADVLTKARKINGVEFKGNQDIITGIGLYDNTVTYSQNNSVFLVDNNNILRVFISLQDENIGNNPFTSFEYWSEQTFADVNLSNVSSSILSIPPISLSNIDGQWIYKAEVLSTATAISTIDLTQKMIEYLPYDNNIYEVLMTIRNSRSDSSGTNTISYVHGFDYTPDGPNSGRYFSVLDTDGTNFQQQSNSFVAIIPADRKLKYTITGHALEASSLSAIAYRRIGTNN